MNYVGNLVIAIARKRMMKGYSRKDFLREMAIYWHLSQKDLKKKELKWLLAGISD
jgi:hypothetical protein